MADRDPFSQTYDMLMEMALGNPTVTSLVRVKNRMMFTAKDTRVMLPRKDEISEGDLPELRILPSGGTPKVGRDSDHTSWLQEFDMQIATGDTDVEALMFPLSFALLCAWTDWHPRFATLTWGGEPFIHTIVATKASQGLAIENENRAITGWASVWSVQADLWLSTAALKRLNTPIQ